jgi:uncharacterized GH25 family protein
MIPTLLILAAFAHDFWIEPATFSPRPGQIVPIKLRVGQDLLGDPVPRDPSLLNRFVLHDAGGRKALPGRDGADPAGLFRVDANGLLVIGYLSNPSSMEQPADKFNQYLQEEGLDRIPRQSASPVHEQFSRCAKSLAAAGPVDPAQSDRLLGFPLELLAEKNPYALGPAENLPVRLFYRNRPIADTLVVAFNRRNPSQKQSARTDAQGRVRFRLAQPGLWLIKAVHMTPAPAKAGWASYWASLTFERK